MKRTLKQWNDAHACTACAAIDGILLADKAADYQPVLATHSVTDAQEQPDGSWKETPPRYGCSTHTVASMVRFLSGECIPFVEYQRRMAAATEAVCQQ